MSAPEHAVEQVAQLADELAHADRLITELVAENERLRAHLAHKDRIIAAFKDRARQGRDLWVIPDTPSTGRAGQVG